MASIYSKNARQTRCERCILAHRPCDGKQPICTTCSSHRDGPKSCVYPPGQPSRSELKKIKMEEANKKAELANEKKRLLAEQAANRKAAGITYGFGKGLYGTVPDSWPERFGGKGGYEKMIALKEAKTRAEAGTGVGEDDDDGNTDNTGQDAAVEKDVDKGKGKAVESSADEEEQPKKRRRKFKKTRAHIIHDISSGSDEFECDIRQGFPSLIGRGSAGGPVEDIAPRAPALGTPFDPYVNPDYFNRTRKSPAQIKEMLFRMAPLPVEYLRTTPGESKEKKEADSEQQE